MNIDDMVFHSISRQVNSDGLVWLNRVLSDRSIPASIDKIYNSVKALADSGKVSLSIIEEKAIFTYIQMVRFMNEEQIERMLSIMTREASAVEDIADSLKKKKIGPTSTKVVNPKETK